MAFRACRKVIWRGKQSWRVRIRWRSTSTHSPVIWSLNRPTHRRCADPWPVVRFLATQLGTFLVEPSERLDDPRAGVVQLAVGLGPSLLRDLCECVDLVPVDGIEKLVQKLFGHVTL